ncbi:DNA topoisomerase IB [Halioxenophilus aromaticivorans]|uniref:DNA topoisomerase IB n=1 Tax=Halioxenophilus aromaticivorans TaxID=1306992 RepID=A0AAV3U4F6_9ALTE
MAQTVVRKKHGKGFTYRYASGKTVKSKALRQWFASLVIPPAWQDVEINLDRDAKIHVTGRDEKQRKQYIYNQAWTEAAEKTKFKRILRFGSQLETMRRVTGQHLLQRPVDANAVLACMTRMMDEAFFRPGSPEYTRANGTHGLTTLRDRHLTFTDEGAEFIYTGKSGKEQHRWIRNDSVCEVLAELESMTGYELFDVTLPDGERRQFSAGDLNDYITEVMGEDFSAKDFRTWAGTVLMAVALEQQGACQNKKQNQSNIVQAVKSVAEKLGNTPAVCRASYIHPEVILQYECGKTLAHFRRQLKKLKQQLMSEEEYATLALLQKAE